jgi:CRP-like cAMP-binding protein
MLHWNGNTVGTPAPNFRALESSATSPTIAETARLMGARMDFRRNAEIFAQGEPAEYLYVIISGAVRLSKMMSDGRRQIGAFYLPGDLFGLEAEETHSFSAESIGQSCIAVVKRSALMARAMHDSELVCELWKQTATHLQRAQGHMLLLGRKNCHERIADFLLDMSSRLHSEGLIELPMSRLDIADYLGLSIETVSRTLTHLERSGIISIPVSRRIVFQDRSALNEMNDVWMM